MIYRSFAAGIYKVKVNNGNTRTRCEICSNLTRHQNGAIGVVLVSLWLTLNIFHIVLVFPLLTLHMQLLAGSMRMEFSSLINLLLELSLSA